MIRPHFVVFMNLGRLKFALWCALLYDALGQMGVHDFEVVMALSLPARLLDPLLGFEDDPNLCVLSEHILRVDTLTPTNPPARPSTPSR